MEFTTWGNNANIQVHILDDIKMVDAGFITCHNDLCIDPYWYMCKQVYGSEFSEITFNMTIYTEKDWQIDILDEAFCQPYDYQWLLTRQNVPKAAYIIKNNVDAIMQQLLDFGIISGWTVGDYI